MSMTRQLRFLVVIGIAFALATVANIYRSELPQFSLWESAPLEFLSSESPLPESRGVESGVEEPPVSSRVWIGNTDIVVSVVVLIGFVIAWVGLLRLRPWARTVYSAMVAIGVEALLFVRPDMSQELTQLLGALTIIATGAVLILLWLSSLASNFRNNESIQRPWVGLLLAALAAPAAEILLAFWKLWAQDTELLRDLSGNAFLLWLRGEPLYSYVGFVGLGWPLVAIFRVFGALTFSRIVILFAFLGAVTYWLSLVYMHEYLVKELFRITGGQPPQLWDWFGGTGSVAKEIFGKGVLLGVLVGTILFSIIGRAGRQGGGAESTQRAFRASAATTAAFTCAVTGLAALALWDQEPTNSRRDLVAAASRQSPISGSYRGKATSKTSGGVSNIRLILDFDSHTKLTGQITITGDFASSGPIEGHTNGQYVAFTSVEQSTEMNISWEGTFDGSRITGTYVVLFPMVFQADDPRLTDHEGAWEVAK
jgi:hypothetical protein